MSDDMPETGPEGNAPGQMEVYRPPRVDRSKMEIWADDLRAAYIIAERLVTTSFAPVAYRDKPQEAAAAIMAGQEIGLSPLVSLRSIDIIEGVPGMRALTLRALVQSHGHEIWIEESNQSRAIVKGRRKGSQRVETSIWNVARAEKMKLMGKVNYQKQPGVMFIARGTSEIARLIDADGIMGLGYSTEELMDLDEVISEEPTKAPAKRAMRRKKLPEPWEVADPPLPEAPTSHVSPEQAAVMSGKARDDDPIDPTEEESDVIGSGPQTLPGPKVTWETAKIPTGDSEEIVEPEINWEDGE